MSTLAVMSDPEKLVPLQIPVPKRTRQLLRFAATTTELTMADIGTIAIDYVASLVVNGDKLPASVSAAIKARQEKRANEQGGS